MVGGPALVEEQIRSVDDISRFQTEVGQRGSTVIFGEMLLVPVDDLILYVRPVFVRAENTGDAITGGEGRYGRYLRFNNPHKLSLYVALGLPVVVWSEAAVARLVRERGIGVAVSDLRELGRLAQSLTAADYRRMTRRLVPLRDAVTHGAFLRRALDDLARAPRRAGESLDWRQE